MSVQQINTCPSSNHVSPHPTLTLLAGFLVLATCNPIPVLGVSNLPDSASKGIREAAQNEPDPLGLDGLPSIPGPAVDVIRAFIRSGLIDPAALALQRNALKSPPPEARSTIPRDEVAIEARELPGSRPSELTLALKQISNHLIAPLSTDEECRKACGLQDNKHKKRGLLDIPAGETRIGNVIKGISDLIVIRHKARDMQGCPEQDIHRKTPQDDPAQLGSQISTDQAPIELQVHST
ncbi:MAG: hypothetical protein M1814_005022 [Vezdaea aestivalis]|nr:MAG: hypothetical protein M1814_005022 [Vezdaea aestivalis]